MNRREFLRQAAALAGLGLAGCPRPSTAAREGPLERARAPKKIIVIGAGLAGLAAGHALVEAGHQVTILEARPRAGGRVQTLREPFADGLYAEAGAFFIPDKHDLTLHYVRRFDLPLDLLPARGTGGLYYIKDRRIQVVRGTRVAWPVELTPEEEGLGLPGIRRKYLDAALREMGDVTAPGWPPAPLLERYDSLSFAAYLRAQGASPGALALLDLDAYLNGLGEGMESYSALNMLRDLAPPIAEKASYTIRGGNDRLPNALAARLKGEIHYGAPVVRIEPGEGSVGVVFRAGWDTQRLRADYVICALPFSVLRHLEIAPPFSPQKQAAISGLPYTSTTRVLVQVRRKVWEAEGLPSSALTDLPIRWIWEPTVTQPGPRAILWAEAGGAEGRRLAAMAEGERTRFVVQEMEKVYPGTRDAFEVAFTKMWHEDEWARGAYPWFKPGQMTALLRDIARPEGRVHFAGEHTSPWSGWMQGALESGLRAAREVHEASQPS